jgi:hypothetical protein
MVTVAGSSQVSPEVLLEAEKTVSCDTIADYKGESRLRGVFSFGGKWWVGVSSSNFQGGEVEAVRIFRPSEWGDQPTKTYAESCTDTMKGAKMYAGVRVKYRGQPYILGAERLRLTVTAPIGETEVLDQPEDAPLLPIPGLLEAAAEAYATAGKIEAERLSLFVQNPPSRELAADSILAGPLFRDTEASPQAGLFCRNSDTATNGNGDHKG